MGGGNHIQYIYIELFAYMSNFPLNKLFAQLQLFLNHFTHLPIFLHELFSLRIPFLLIALFTHTLFCLINCLKICFFCPQICFMLLLMTYITFPFIEKIICSYMYMYFPLLLWEMFTIMKCNSVSALMNCLPMYAFFLL